MDGAQPKNFSGHIDATKTSSFSLQGRNRAAPVGDEESWGDPAASTILAIVVFLGQVLIRVCVLLQRKLSLFLVAGQGE